MAKNKDKEVRIEQAENGFIVRTEKKVMRPKSAKPTADEVMYPRYDWVHEEHIAADLQAAMIIVQTFFSSTE